LFNDVFVKSQIVMTLSGVSYLIHTQYVGRRGFISNATGDLTTLFQTTKLGQRMKRNEIDRNGKGKEIG